MLCCVCCVSKEHGGWNPKTFGNSRDWQRSLGGGYRQSYSNDADVIAGVTGLRRKDDRWRGNLEVECRLNRHLDLVAEYHYSSNGSNILARRYRRNQYLLGLQGNF